MNDFSVAERTVVVTGATSGLGRAAAARMLRTPGVTVVVAARDAERGEHAARELAAEAAGAGHAAAGAGHAAVGAGETAAGRAIALPLDLASLDSVRAFPAALETAGLPPLHALVANAGIQFTDRAHTSADGFEATFATNHLGHFLLVRLLLDRLADDGRVVIVSSSTHKHQRLRNGGYPPPRWADARTLATPDPSGSGQVAYATSKLANAMTALELSRRIDDLRPGARIAVHAFDPGLMPATGLARDYPPRAQRLYARAAPLLTALIPGATTAERSGEQLAHMTLDPTFAAPPAGPRNGRYIELTRDGIPSAQARDAAAAAALWRDSAALVGLAEG